MIIDGKRVVVNGFFPRVVRLRSEFYEFVDYPESFVSEMKRSSIRADVFTFLQRIMDQSPRFDYLQEFEPIALLPIKTFDHWWKKQINAKTRNMCRRAHKAGVEIKIVEFNDDFVRGIQKIYNESKVRQGKPFSHYGESFETLKNNHISFLDRSIFIGAYFRDELIGFVKLVHGDGVSNLMQIISMLSHRDKAPTNALIARSVEICAERGIPYLHYGIWGRSGLRDFKIHHAFERHDVPRFYVPLNTAGRLSLRLGLHRGFAERLPEQWIIYLNDFRSKLYSRHTSKEPRLKEL